MRQSNADWEKELSEAPLGMGGFSGKTMKKIKERIAMSAKPKRKYRPLLAATTALVLLSAGWLIKGAITDWPNNESTIREPAAATWDQEDVKLIVQYPDPANFMSSTGSLFVIQHPTVKFEVTEGPESYDFDTYKQWIEETRPDILQVPLNMIEPLAEAGLIQSLDEWIKRDSYVLDDFHEPVLSTLRAAGGGSLYGFAPNFRSYALFYNKTLFQQHNLELPTDRMSWEEVLQLAALFQNVDTANEPLYGLTTPWNDAPFELIQHIGGADKLRLASSVGLEPSVNSAAWEDVWNSVVRGYKEGWISFEQQADAVLKSATDKELYANEPFLQGRAAIAVQPNHFLHAITNAEEAGAFSDEWDVVTQPVSPRNRDEAAAGFSVGMIYAVNAHTPHPEAAWSFLQYLMSPEKAKQDERLSLVLLPTRISSSQADNAAGVFYKLGVDSAAIIEQTSGRFASTAYGQLIRTIVSGGDEEAKAAIAGTRTVPEALSRLQAAAEKTAAAVKASSADEKDSP